MATKKRGQSEGTVYQRPNGSWCGQVSVGNRKRKTVYGRTAAEARAKIAEIKASLSQGIALPKRMTVSVLIEAWLEAKKPTVRHTTFTGYQLTLNKHVVPVIGTLKIAAVTPTDLEAMYSTCAETISPKSIRNIHASLKSCFDWAVRRDWLARNPVALIAATDLPKVIRRPPVVLTPEQARKLIDTASGTRSEALIAVAVTTGARVGELQGLTWDRVILPKKAKQPATLRVDRALQFIDRKPVLVEPKTPSGNRVIALTPTAATALRRLRVQQNETALRLGDSWANDLDLVFVGENGRPLTRKSVLKSYFRPLLREAGLPEKMRFHSLRHSAASLLIAQGVAIPLVSKMLGHSTPSFTMSIYSHAIPNSEHIAASAMETILGN
jgi:integrase